VYALPCLLATANSDSSAAVPSIFDKAEFPNHLLRQSLFIVKYRVKDYPLFLLFD